MDDLSYDAQHKSIYVACGEGYLDIIQQQDADHYRLQQHFPTLPGARNFVLAADSSQFYLAIPQRGNQEAEIRVFAA